MIITLETIYTAFCLLGVYKLCRKMNASRKEFKGAKKFAVFGLVTAIFVYYFIYVIILNEWFDLEYSAQSEAFDWARSNIEYMFPALIYLTLDNDN